MSLGFLAGIVGLARDFRDGQPPSNDFIHGPLVQSAYRRTDYLVNSDMAIPIGLAGSWRYGVAWELMVRRGLPEVCREAHYSPLVLAPGKLPDRAGR